MNWLHLLWIAPLVFATGYYLGTAVGAIKLDREKGKWRHECARLIDRKDAICAELTARNEIAIQKLRNDIYNLSEKNANLRHRMEYIEDGRRIK